MSKFLLIILTVAFVLSCSKSSTETYIVSANKIIDLTGSNWSTSETQLNDKKGYEYTKSPDNLSTVIKAEVHLPAIDDSNRTVNGTILLNISPDNKVNFASFYTPRISKSVAYAMLLNYVNETLQNVTAVTSSIGGFVENGNGGNTTASAILTKVQNNQDADQLDVTYYTPQGTFTAVVFRQYDGSYIFSYRGRP